MGFGVACFTLPQECLGSSLQYNGPLLYGLLLIESSNYYTREINTSFSLLRLQLTMVLTCLAVLFAVVATGLSASIASQYSHNDKDEDEDCDKSFKSLYHQSRRIGIDCDDDDINSGVEWALMGVSLAALLNNIVAASLVFYGMRFPVCK